MEKSLLSFKKLNFLILVLIGFNHLFAETNPLNNSFQTNIKIQPELYSGFFSFKKSDFVCEEINQIENDQDIFHNYDLFTKDKSLSKSTKYLTSVSQVTILTLNKSVLGQILSEAPETISLALPYQEEYLQLELYKNEVLTLDFKAFDQNGNIIEYTPGKYYRGIVKNDPTSLVTLSFFDDDIMGIVSTNDHGNIVLGKSVDKNDYITYSDRNLLKENSFHCGVDELESNQEILNTTNFDTSNHFQNQTEKCVRIYYEISNNIYLENGNSETATLNWLTGIQNNIDAIYANDGISVALHRVKIWTSPDPYNDLKNYNLLNFKDMATDFEGDLAHLIKFGNAGGTAYLDSLCTDNRYAYSEVSMSYSQVPIYSYTIFIIAHEMGHILGSPHTHACVWNGDNSAIDGCGPSVGYYEGCYGPIPSEGGTIMSYCHLDSVGVGINLNLGFGPQPAALIRSRVDGKSCLGIDCNNGPFYCDFLISNNVEPITKVVVSNLENSSSPTINGSPALEDFTSKKAKAVIGKSYQISVEGNTNGNNSNYIKAWIDWDGNGSWDNSNEIFEIGLIQNSNGTDGKKAIGVITVPYTAKEGITLMRIIKSDESFPSDPCSNYTNGQAEDYLVDVKLAGCLNGYQVNTYTPFCYGKKEPVAKTYSHYYDKVNLTAEVKYTFSSNIHSDFITISNENGTETLAYGHGEILYTPTENEIVRFYVHSNSDCLHDDNNLRFKTVKCGDKINVPDSDYPCNDGLNTGLRYKILEVTSQFNKRVAEIFIVQPDDEFTIKQIKLEVTSKEYPNYATFNIRENFNDAPGEIIETFSLVPTEILPYDNYLSKTVFHLIFDLETPITLSENVYWLEPILSTEGMEEVFWVSSRDSDNRGYIMHLSNDSGQTWFANPASGLSPMLFSVSGNCLIELGVNTMDYLDFSYYPNPVTDELFFKTEKNINTIEIYNLNGQKLKTQTKIKDNKTTLKSLNTGVYLFKVKLEGGQIETFKIIKK